VQIVHMAAIKLLWLFTFASLVTIAAQASHHQHTVFPKRLSGVFYCVCQERFGKLSGFLPLGLQHSPLPTIQSPTDSASSGTRSQSLSAAPGGPNFTPPPPSHPDSGPGVSKSTGARLTSHVHKTGSPPPLPPHVPSPRFLIRVQVPCLL